MPFRVVQHSTGNVGRYALRAILNHPELELAGVVVSSHEKEGKDAAELCGLSEPTGIQATRDFAALLAEKPDCVSYTAAAEMRLMDAVEDMARALEAGVNVCSSSLVMLTFPCPEVAAFTQPLAAAAERGKATMLTTGIDPGFATDMMPLLFSGLSERWQSIRMQEVVNYATYNQPSTLRDVMGFGKPLGETPMLLMPGILSMAWGGCVRMVAAGVGVDLERIEEWYERVPADRDLDVPALGRVEKGMAAALRFEVRGIVAGRPAIVLEHVTRLSDELCPDWPQGKGYRAIIEGEPRMHVSLDMEDSHGDHAVGGVILTATRLVNSIPAVVAHAPGLISALDLPLITGRGLYRPA